MTDYVVKPLDANTWDAFSRLVERHNGVFGGCLVPLLEGAVVLGAPRTCKMELVQCEGCALRVRELLVAGAPKLQDLEYEAN